MPRLVQQRITPFLCFDDRAEEAARFYVSIFDDSRITGITRCDEESARASGRPKGSVGDRACSSRMPSRSS